LLNSPIPTLLRFVEGSDDPTILYPVIDRLGGCLEKVNHDRFMELCVPVFGQCWSGPGKQILAKSIVDVCRKLTPAPPFRYKYIIPMSAELLVAKGIVTAACEESGVVVIQSVDTGRAERDLDSQAAGPRPD